MPRDDPRCPVDSDLLPLATGDELLPERRMELESHVSCCPDCQDEIVRLRSSVEELRRLARPWGARRPPENPSAIGKYRVIGLLGSGGQADVYRVAHPALEKELVLKLARDRVGEDVSRRGRLVEEGRLLSQLDHPAIARIHDLDFHDGRPFLVLEFVRGRNLAQLAREESLPPRRAAALVAPLARAIGAAHRAGIVHQDLKPENVVIDADGRPRIIDFGLASIRQAWVAQAVERGTISGTVQFMPPEQARGETERIGPRSDIFALGAVLYFLFTGKAPFEEATLERALERAALCNFDRLALRAHGVPRRLEMACLKAMEARPEDRHGSAEDLARELERFARWPRARVFLVLFAVLILAAVSIALWMRSSREAVEGPRQMAAASEPGIRLIVTRGEVPFRLADALPLRTGDGLQIRFEVPAGLGASLFWLDTDGKLQELPCVEIPSPGPGRILACPGPGSMLPLEGPPGTELIVACARSRGPPRREELERLLLPAGPWPGLPADTVLRLDREGPRLQGQRGPGVPKTLADGLIRRAEALWLELTKTFEWAAALAFRHDG